MKSKKPILKIEHILWLLIGIAAMAYLRTLATDAGVSVAHRIERSW